MTIAEWVSQRERRVPDAFQFGSRTDVEVSLPALVNAAEEALSACGDDHDRRAAYALLAADAYITYACLWAVEEEEDFGTLRDVADRVVRAWGTGDGR
ncbi:MAG: hypothetical protein OXH51_13360 [Gemmatimonadetes bacterium]|nr:hypothetical protein [Gemmatimonadota bacterium]MCY3677667.1 hypothetical protein [Gemmatimonadota bacterium]MYA42300.1 hypothetical protein [Gemmatimonadota bacterium]MYE92244.1 hypothetical protein [Gemmatimonadota bacterium]MYJ11653.1 hypothetical protein [Gemmatimonadota bacterium]